MAVISITGELIALVAGGVLVTGFIKSVYEPLSEYYFKKKVIPILVPFYDKVDQFLPQWIQDFTAEELSELLENEIEQINDNSRSSLNDKELKKAYKYALDNMDILKMADKIPSASQQGVKKDPYGEGHGFIESPIEVLREQPPQTQPEWNDPNG